MTGTANSLMLRRRFGILADQVADARDGGQTPRKKSEQVAIRPRADVANPFMLMLWLGLCLN